MVDKAVIAYDDHFKVKCKSGMVPAVFACETGKNLTLVLLL